MKVFLGGTANNSEWRKYIIDRIKIDYFDPIVDDWNEEAQERERLERENCDFVLYVITPKMTGVYSIAEVVEDSIKRPQKTLFCILNEDDENEFTEHQYKSLNQVKEMVIRNGARTFNTLDEIIEFLNYFS